MIELLIILFLLLFMCRWERIVRESYQRDVDDIQYQYDLLMEQYLEMTRLAQEIEIESEIRRLQIFRPHLN